MKHISAKLMCIAAGMMVLLFTNGCKNISISNPLPSWAPKGIHRCSNTLKALSGVYSRLGWRPGLWYTPEFVLSDWIMMKCGTTGNPIMTGGTSPVTSRQPVMPSWKDLSIIVISGIEYANICIDNIPKMYDNGSEK